MPKFHEVCFAQVEHGISMTPNYELLPVLMQWLHVGSVVLMIGGFFFLRVVLLPAAKVLPDPRKTEMIEAVFRRFRVIVWIALLAILVSGVYNFVAFLISTNNQTVTAPNLASDYSLYILVLGVKFLIVFLIFTLGILLTFPYPVYAPIQKHPAPWLNITVILGLIVIFLSTFLRRMY